MLRRLGTTLTALSLLLAPLAVTTTSQADNRLGVPRPSIRVDWPTAPVADKPFTVRVTRATGGTATAVLQQRIGTVWVDLTRKTVTTRSFTFQRAASANRFTVRVAVAGNVSRPATAPLPTALRTTVRYADPAIHPRPRGRAVTLLLDGRRGQRVALTTKGGGPAACTTTDLRGPRGLLARDRYGYWRLPRNAPYTLTLVPCPAFGFTKVDLDRVRLVPLTVDAAPVALRHRQGVQDVGALQVPSTGRVMVRGWDVDYPWSQIIVPTGQRARWYGSSLTYFEAGQNLHNSNSDSLTRVTAGRYLLVPDDDFVTASASTAVRTAVTPEGPAVTLGDDGVVGRERGFTFTGAADTFYYPETELPGRESGGGGELVGPDGALVRDWDDQRGWLLPADGSYTLYVAPSLADVLTDTPVTVRLRRAVMQAWVPAGATVRLTATEAGRWVVAPTDPPRFENARHLVSSSPTMTGPWQASLRWPFTPRCVPDPHGPLGCGEPLTALVDQSTSTADVFLPSSSPFPGLLVLQPANGVTGSVDLTVTP